MEELSNMCRICLADDVGMRLIANTHLQEMYESLTLLPLQRKDGRPIQVCFICCGSLQNCYKLKNKCLQSEELFTRVLSSGVLQPLPKEGCTQRLRVVHPVVSLSVGDVSQIIICNETSVNNDDRTDMLEVGVHVEVEQDDGDIKIEPQEEHETQIDNDIQCSHLEDPLDVTKREPDDIETDAEDTNLEIDDITIKESEPLSVHRSSVSANDICPKTVKVVLERMVLNDTIPVIGVSALKKLPQNDSLLSIEPENANKSVVIDKLTAVSNINTTVDKVDDTLYTHVDIYKQTSESEICSIKEDYSSKSHFELQTTRTHTGEKQFQCDICNKSFMRKGGLTRHMYTHSDKKPFNCDVCNESFTRTDYLTKHMYTHTGEKPKCDVCNRSFMRKDSLTQHMYTHSSEKPFKCDVCNKLFRYKTCLKRHMYTHTGEKPVKCDVKPFKCHKCNESFTMKSILTLHILRHTGEKPFKCDVCNKSFITKGNLTQHMYIHIGKKSFKCDVCNKSFTLKYNLTLHMNTHTGKKPFKCDVCNKRFRFKHRLKQHMYTHTGEKPFKCDVCNESFKMKVTLIQHIFKHTGEKPFKCDVCHKSFTRKDYLTLHMCTHTGEKPFNCYVCNKSFKRKDNLTKHMYTHTGEKSFKSFMQ